MKMNSIFVSLVVASGLTFSVRAADVTIKITDVHMCCDSCVKGAQKAVATVKGATAAVDKEEKTVTLTGEDKSMVQKAADALVAAGYFGKSTDASLKISAATGAKGKKVEYLKVQGVHLCCGKCVKAVNTALGEVNGVTGNTAAKGAKSFTVNGDFNDKEVFSALQKAGLTGQAK